VTRIAVRVQPGARGRGLVGWMADGTLKIRVSEPPEGGRANRAVAELMAAALGVRASAVTVVRGHGARAKLIEVDGISAEQARTRIASALAAAAREGSEPA
jgi:hypothetical protein